MYTISTRTTEAYKADREYRFVFLNRRPMAAGQKTTRERTNTGSIEKAAFGNYRKEIRQRKMPPQIALVLYNLYICT